MKSKPSWMTKTRMPTLLAWLAMCAAIGTAPETLRGADNAGQNDSAVNGILQKLLKKPKTPDEEQAEISDADLVLEAAESLGEAEPVDADITVSPEGRVEMHPRDLELSLALQILSMQSQRNIIASPNVSGTVTANLYGVTFEEALTAILDGNNCKWIERGNFIYVYTNEEFMAMQLAANPPVSRLFKLHYARAEDVDKLIQPLLSENGKISLSPPAEVGVAANADETGGNAMAINDCILVVDQPSRIDEIAKVIARIDVCPQQVLVEATILRAQLNEDNALGIDFNILGGVDFETLNATSPGVTDLAVGNLPLTNMRNTNVTTRTDFNAAVPDGGFTFGVVKGSVSVFIRALEQLTDTIVLANPKIQVVDKQHGEVIVGRRDGYLTTTVTETAAVQTVEFLETGTQLIFRPYIGHDGHVRMEIHPKDSTGGLTAANLPFEQTTECTTQIIVRDGHTILIGGLFREVSSSGRGQVPVLGNIPVAGALFRNSRDSTQREEVIILLTVRLVKEPSAVAEEGMAALNDVERFRVGMREGLQWFGRERLAQAHYRWALDHLNKGHQGQALWDLDLAINNNPKLMAAIKLREKITGHRKWDDEGSSVRGFLARQIMKDTGSVVPLFGRPEPMLEIPPILGPSGFDAGPNSEPQASIDALRPDSNDFLSSASGKEAS